MNETGASQAPRRGILLMFVAGVLLAFGVFRCCSQVVRQAMSMLRRRVVSGCESIVELPTSGRYLVSVESSGRSLSAEQACREIPAGLRSGELESVRMLSPTGSRAEIPVAAATSRIVAGGQRASLGVVEVDVAGSMRLRSWAPEMWLSRLVLTLQGCEPGLVVGNWLPHAAVACLLVVRPRSRQRGVATETNQWSAPLAKDRLG